MTKPLHNLTTSIKVLIMAALSGLLMLWYVVPSIHLNYKYAVIAVASVAVAGFAFLVEKRIRIDEIKVFVCCVFLSLFYFLVPYSFEFKEALNTFQQIVIFTIPFIAGMFLVHNYNAQKFTAIICRIVVILLSIAWIYILIRTIMELRVSPSICRDLASGTLSDELLKIKKSNVGGFGFSYAIGFLGIYSFYMFVHNKKWKRAAAFFAFIFFTLFVFKSQYTTLLFLCLVVDYIILVDNSKRIATKISLMFLLVIFLAASGTIFSWAANIIPLENLAKHFEEISNMMSGKGYDSLRMSYFTDAWKLFLKSPLIGNVGLINNTRSLSIALSSHSTQIKILLETGIIGSIIYNVYMFLICRTIYRTLKKYGYCFKAFLFCFLYFWILSWFNPVYETYELPVMLFMFIPLMTCSFNIKNDIGRC